ncbi:MAG: hypothetical protein LH481_04735 [Burkholderiales bacterium]|nr:hypothetical protein [Burkholderiales bacterium]
MPNSKKAVSSNGPISEQLRETTMMSLINDKGKDKSSSGKSATSTKRAVGKQTSTRKSH